MDKERFQYLLDDLNKRGMGIHFGTNAEAKEKALSFKQFALENKVLVHVICDERKRWSIVTDKMFQSVNKQWKLLGRPEQISY